MASIPPAHSLLGGESEYVSEACGWPSGLTDKERAALMNGVVEVVMDRLGVDEAEARELFAPNLVPIARQAFTRFRAAVPDWREEIVDLIATGLGPVTSSL